MSAPRPTISAVQPEGWVRLRIDDTIEDQIAALSASIARGAEASRRDIVRAHLRRVFRDLAAKAAGTTYEVWMPVAATGGVTIPLTITIGPLPTQPDPGLGVADVLLSIAGGSAGARATSVGGRLAARTVSDVAGVKDDEGNYTSFPRRRVIVTVSPGDEWLAFLGEIIVPDAPDAAAIVEASEFFFDALLATVSFGEDTIADAAARARESDAGSQHPERDA